MSKAQLSRRQFLHLMSLLPIAGQAPQLLSPAQQAQALSLLNRLTQPDSPRQPQQLEREALLPNYLQNLDRPYNAPLNAEVDAFPEDFQTLGAIFYDLSSHRLIAQHKSEAMLPVASAFKGPVLLYFLDVIDPEVWSRVPVQYWKQTDESAVPSRYRAAWREHQTILNYLYAMLVYSDNRDTGRVLEYIANSMDSTSPFVDFNDWSHQRVGISQLSALSLWTYGIPPRMDATDPRYLGRRVNINSRMFTFENLMTPRDLGLYYVWFFSQANEEQLRVGKALLSAVEDERRANLERLAHDNDGLAYSKNGSFLQDENQGGNAITDAGIIELADGRWFLVVFLSLGFENRIDDLFGFFDAVIDGDYDSQIQDFVENGSDEPDHSLILEQHITSNYPYSEQVIEGQYNYAFVRYEGVPLYSSPAETLAVRNPVISSSKFGVHLLMQGALVRYIQREDGWAELLPDNEQDNVRNRLADRIFTRMDNLWPIANEHVQEIPFLVNPAVTPEQKYLVLDINGRELAACEGNQVAFKTPIILNRFATPRGSYVITTKWFARSMQPWAPGVPFTAFFHEEGYALHGSPWQRWQSTVTEKIVTERTSAGCVNIPNWTLPVGSYSRPIDELLFRWIGGLAKPGELVFEYAAQSNYPTLRVFALDAFDELQRYAVPNGVDRGLMVTLIKEAPLLAPPQFFEAAEA